MGWRSPRPGGRRPRRGACARHRVPHRLRRGAARDRRRPARRRRPTWRRRFALVLGLQRILSEDKPHLADGLELRAHQVDALAGMLAALLGDAQRNWEDDAAARGRQRQRQRQRRRRRCAAAAGRRLGRGRLGRRAADADARLRARGRRRVGPSGEDDEDEDDDDDTGEDDRRGRRGDATPRPSAEPLHDPGAVRRYRFKHPTASGKTVAAAGFVDAATITGVLILTHRRLLVEQFKRDLTQHGYGGRIREAILERQARADARRRSRSRRTRGSSATPSC